MARQRAGRERPVVPGVFTRSDGPDAPRCGILSEARARTTPGPMLQIGFRGDANVRAGTSRSRRRATSQRGGSEPARS